jgi:hypothetical protein
MADKPEREALLKEMHRLNCEIGYAGFRLQYFNDAAAIAEWPDPVTRDRELRAFWAAEAERHYLFYRSSLADVSTEDLTAWRDGLRVILGGRTIDHVDYFNSIFEAGPRAQSEQNGPDRGPER